MGRFEKTDEYKSLEKEERFISHNSLQRPNICIVYTQKKKTKEAEQQKQKEKKKTLQVKKSVLMLREKGEWGGLKLHIERIYLLEKKKMSQNNQHQYITALRKRAFGHSSKDQKKN